MSLWLRTLALALAFATSGAPQAAVELFAADECGDEESCDCATCFDACLCCPARASLVTQLEPLPAPQVVAGAGFAPLDEPVVALSTADIFHPPRA